MTADSQLSSAKRLRAGKNFRAADQDTAMKGPLLKARFRAQKRCACAICKPQQRGWEDKKTVCDRCMAVRDEAQLREVDAR